MSNSNYNIAGIEEQSQAFASGAISQKDACANLLGLVWSAKTAQYVKAKGARPMINTGDLSFNKAQYADNTKFHALQRGYVLANTERFGTVGLAGFNTLELFGMDRDTVKAHKLKLCAGNKKPVNAAQKKALAAFIKAQRTTDNRISTGMANLRGSVNSMLGVPKVEKPNKAPKAQTAKGKDTQTGNVSTDTEIESGTTTEAKTSVLPPMIRDPRLVNLLNTVAQYDLSGQARFVEIMALAIEAYNKEPAPTIESSLGLKK